MSEYTKIRARGPWVWVRPENPPRVSTGGIYLPEGNALERLGYTVAEVLSAGPGYWKKKPAIPGHSAKDVWHPMEVKEGDRVIFRGHLKAANRVPVDDKTCLMHIDDLAGILGEGEELGLALPYDN
jgi:co-chaperonin GroES (HSP10)